MKKIIIKILKRIIRLIEPNPKNNIEEDLGYSEVLGRKFHYHYKPAFDITFDELDYAYEKIIQGVRRLKSLSN